jgi:hypothetical protein
MLNARHITRIGMLAAGLGIGAALAVTPASADSSTDLWSDLVGGLSLPTAGAPSALDFQISIDGQDLFSTVGNEATATSGSGDIAIAWGNGATASATGGTGDFAYAHGSNAFAAAGGVGTDTGADHDTAIDIGNNDTLAAGTMPDGATAGNADLVGFSGGATGINDTAIDIGNNTGYDGDGSYDGAFAGAAPLFGGEAGTGNGDTAIDVGNNSGTDNGSFALLGNDNYAGDSGSNTGVNEGAFAASGNDNTAVADTDYTNYAKVFAGDGDHNYADVVGPENSFAVAGGGNDAALVLDPFGSTASDALSGTDASGAGGTHDLAAVLLTDGSATAQSGDYLYDILSALGHETGTFSGTLLTDLASLF